MLTYRAVESNSETLACDIAAYLYGVQASFDKFAAGSKCTVTPPPGGGPGIVVMSVDQNVVDAFQFWRADIETMTELLSRSKSYCGIPQQPMGAGGPSSLNSLTPAGNALGLAQSALGVFATQTEISSVPGTVQDQAFIDGVARQLSVLRIPVIVPAIYVSHALSGLDEKRSPFLTMFSQIMTCRDRIIEAAGKDASDKLAAQLSTDMNAFLAGLGGSATSSTRSTAGNGTGGETATGGGTTTPVSPQIQPTSPVPGLASALLADGLAQALGIDPTNSTAQEHWQHILLLKALESGGTVTKTLSIFGTRIHYSGGAVGTFALLTREGTLECSGNVFDFGGSVSAKNFERDLHKYTPDLSTQLLFKRGSCTVPNLSGH